MLITIMIAFCLGLLYILPHYTNKIYYLAPANVTSKDIESCKGLYGVLNVTFLIAWLLSSAFNKASISDMDLDPDENGSGDDRFDTDGVETADGSVHGGDY